MRFRTRDPKLLEKISALVDGVGKLGAFTYRGVEYSLDETLLKSMHATGINDPEVAAEMAAQVKRRLVMASISDLLLENEALKHDLIEFKARVALLEKELGERMRLIATSFTPKEIAYIKALHDLGLEPGTLCDMFATDMGTMHVLLGMKPEKKRAKAKKKAARAGKGGKAPKSTGKATITHRKRLQGPKTKTPTRRAPGASKRVGARAARK